MLPKYRGGNPYSRVLINGETETGVTIHFMDESFDTGDIIAQKPYHIHSKATMGTIFNELNVLGIELLLQVLRAYENQPLPRIKQPVGDFVSGKGLSEKELFINYNRTAEEIERFVRALNPFILASTTNPKEYIQRRGRVLRKCKGKEFAVIYDFITLPRPLDEALNLTFDEIKCEKSMVRNEINRMIEFKRLALNRMESDKLIYEITDTYRLNENEGIEDDFNIEEGYYD